MAEENTDQNESPQVELSVIRKVRSLIDKAHRLGLAFEPKTPEIKAAAEEYARRAGYASFRHMQNDPWGRYDRIITNPSGNRSGGP